MSNNEVNVRVTAGTEDLRRGMGEAPGIVQQATQRMRDAFGQLREGTRGAMDDMRQQVTDAARGAAGSFGGLVDVLGTTKGGFLALAAVVAMVGFKKAVDETAAMTEAAMDLGRALGLTSNEARVYQAAMDDIGAGPGELEGAAKGLSRQLKENEADMNKLGLVTRDAAGNFRPMTELVLDGIEVLNGYNEGADRAIASQEIFGRGIDASSKLLMFNRDTLEENRQAVEDLGLQVGANAVAAWKDFDAASDRAGLSLKGITNAIGRALMPVMTDLVNMFNAIMPAAITVVRGALGGLAAAWIGVRNGVVVVWETINAMVVTVAEPVLALSRAIGRAMTGDFAGAAEAIKGIGTNIAGAWGAAMDRIGASSEKAAQQLAGIFLPDTAAGETGGSKGGKTAPNLKVPTPPPAAPAEKEPPSMMAYYQAALEEEKNLAAQRNALLDFTKQQEVAFWRDLLDNAELTAKDRLEISRRVAKLETGILRDAAKERVALDQAVRDGAQASALAAVAAADEAARTAYDLQQIGYQDLLALEAQHEQQRLEIKRTYLEARRAQIDPERDPVAFERASQQIEEAERAHLQRMAELRRQQALNLAAPGLQAAENMRAGFQNVLAGIGTQIKTVGDLFKGLGMVIWQTLAQAGAKIVADWIMKNIMMKAIGKVTALGRIGEESAKAGAGGVASMAAAPFPLNLTAPAFGASMAAAATAFAPLASAEGGWDIPAGTTGLMRFHEREMMLPAKHADVIRDLADNGGAAGGGGAPITIHGTPDDTVKVRDLGRLLKSMKRDFVITKGDLR